MKNEEKLCPDEVKIYDMVATHDFSLLSASLEVCPYRFTIVIRIDANHQERQQNQKAAHF